MATPVLLTVQEVAARLRIGIRTVWRWSKRGEIPAPVRLGKFGKVIRWNAEEIDNFLRVIVGSLPAEDSDDESS